MTYVAAVVFAFALNIPTVSAAQSVSASDTVIMAVFLGLLGLALGGLVGWALEERGVEVPLGGFAHEDVPRLGWTG